MLHSKEKTNALKWLKELLVSLYAMVKEMKLIKSQPFGIKA